MNIFGNLVNSSLLSNAHDQVKATNSHFILLLLLFRHCIQEYQHVKLRLIITLGSHT